MAEETTTPIEQYIDSLIGMRTNGYGFIDGLDDNWINVLCGFAKETNDEWFLRRAGIKDPRDRDEFKDWTRKVTQSGETIPYDAFTTFVLKITKYHLQHGG